MMIGLRLFDVSLRDGLQSVSRFYKFSEKKDLLHKIINKYNPEKIEVGSIVNSKVLPQMHDSLKLYNYCRELNLNNCPNLNKLYILPGCKVIQEIILNKLKEPLYSP